LGAGGAPDRSGGRIVFAKQVEGGKNDVVTAQLDGTDMRPVTSTPDVSESSPDWTR